MPSFYRFVPSDTDRCCLCTSGRSDRGVAQVSELYQREVLEWDVVQRGLYRSFTGIFRTPVRDTVSRLGLILILPTPVRNASSTFAQTGRLRTFMTPKSQQCRGGRGRC